MKKDFNVQEFIDLYNQKTSIKNVLKIEQYIPYQKKAMLAQKIVENSSYEVEPIIENEQIVKDEKTGQEKYKKTNHIKIDSNNRYILTVFTVLESYTNIKMNPNNMLGEYDLLRKSGLVDTIYQEIPDGEMQEFNAVLKATYEDFLTNNYETHNFISNQIRRISDVLSTTFKPVVDKISNLNQDYINQIWEEYKKLYSKSR